MKLRAAAILVLISMFGLSVTAAVYVGVWAGLTVLFVGVGMIGLAGLRD